MSGIPSRATRRMLAVSTAFMLLLFPCFGAGDPTFTLVSRSLASSVLPSGITRLVLQNITVRGRRETIEVPK